MNTLWNLKTKRVQQLRDEKDIDDKLNKNLDKCPQTISKFLLFMRELNRTHFSCVSECSIFQYTEVVQKNLESIDEIYQNLLYIEEKDMCHFLTKY